MTPPFFTASLSSASAAVVPCVPQTARPISSRMRATLSPMAGVGASERSTMPNGVSSRRRRLGRDHLPHAGDLEGGLFDRFRHDIERFALALLQRVVYHALQKCKGAAVRCRGGNDQKDRLPDHPHGADGRDRGVPPAGCAVRHRRPLARADARHRATASPASSRRWVLPSCGTHGTTAALALLNDAVKKGGVMASGHVGGLSGAFIPVSEDEGMIAAARSGVADNRQARGHDLRLLRGARHDRRPRRHDG